MSNKKREICMYMLMCPYTVLKVQYLLGWCPMETAMSPSTELMPPAITTRSIFFVVLQGKTPLGNDIIAQ